MNNTTTRYQLTNQNTGRVIGNYKTKAEASNYSANLEAATGGQYQIKAVTVRVEEQPVGCSCTMNDYGWLHTCESCG